MSQRSKRSQARKIGRRVAVDLPGGVLDVLPEETHRPKVVYRLAGDEYVLVEYGEMVLDLSLRFRVEALERAIRDAGHDAIAELNPGVRSLLVRYDGQRLPLPKLLGILRVLEETLPSVEEIQVRSRVVYLPIAYHDRWTRDAVRAYMESVRSEAPYLPDNMEFVARCNGLSGPDDVAYYHTATQHLVLGLGDVFLGAPCAVPLDPRYRLVVPKYNPARLWSPEGAVGIGGAYVCIYPMESPGGYQLVGRTISIWDTWQRSPAFAEAPWLLRFFDRIQFEPVSEEGLEEIRSAAEKGAYAPRIEDDVFSVREYNWFLSEVQEEAAAWRARQRAAVASATEGY
jgi:urea carboxylase